MKDGKLKRILALIGVVLLAGMYVMTLIFAFVDPTAGKLWLKASLVCTIFVPVFLYACMMLTRYLKKEKSPKKARTLQRAGLRFYRNVSSSSFACS